MTDQKPNFLGRALEDAQVFGRTVGLVTKIGQVKLNMSKLKRERESLLRNIGIALHELYRESPELEGSAMLEAVGDDLVNLQEIEAELQDGVNEIARLRADFREASAPKAQPQKPTEKPNKNRTVNQAGPQSADQPNQPNQQYMNQPNQQYMNQPNQQYMNQPNQQYMNQPNQQYMDQPNQQYANQPNQQYTNQPNQQYTNQPNPQYTNQPSPQYTNQPNPQYTNQPSPQNPNPPQQQIPPVPNHGGMPWTPPNPNPQPEQPRHSAVLDEMTDDSDEEERPRPKKPEKPAQQQGIPDWGPKKNN